MWIASGEGSASIYPWSPQSNEAGSLTDKDDTRSHEGAAALCLLQERTWVTKGGWCSNPNKNSDTLSPSFLTSCLPSFFSVSSPSTSCVTSLLFSQFSAFIVSESNRLSLRWSACDVKRLLQKMSAAVRIVQAQVEIKKCLFVWFTIS